MCRAQRCHFVGTHDHPGHPLAARLQVRKALDECRVIATQVGEPIFDAQARGQLHQLLGGGDLRFSWHNSSLL
jgi:hypothetical protein